MAITKVIFPGAVDTAQLSVELAALGLPNLKSVVLLSRGTDTDGVLVKDENGSPITVARYVAINSDPLTAAQTTAVEDAVNAHIPVLPPPPTDADRAEAELRDSKAFLGFGRLTTGNDALTEDELAVLVRSKFP